jgi:autotransporter-associated beta strand protein
MELYTNASNNVSAVQMQQAMQNLSVAKDPSGNPIELSLTEFGVATGQAPSAANYATDLTTALTMMYGDPQADTFGYWGGIGGPNDQDVGSNGVDYSLYNSTYTLTPTGSVWQSWMNQYSTNLSLTTNSAGQITFSNATYGLYDVIVGGQTYQLNLQKGTTGYGLMTPIGADTWNGAGSDNNWSTTGNWVNGSFAANAPLIFAGTTQLNANNNSAANTEYSGITFNSGAGPFVITGNAINLAGDIVNNSSSVQTINTNLAMQTNTNFNAASGNLAVGGAISGAFSLTKLGAHTLTLNGLNSYSGSTNVSAGTLVIGASGALPTNTSVAINGTSTLQLGLGTGLQTVSSLAIASGAALDINNNAVIINYGSGADPIASIASWIISGYASGGWSGPGIMSTAAQSNIGTYGIGYADAADAGNPANLAPGTIEIMYTLLGDANLDGKVNGADFNIMAANFNQAVTDGWDEGDFNYDGAVNGNDFVLLADNFNQFASQSAASEADFAALESFAAANGISLASVPEPTTGVVLLLAGAGISMRRRRKRAAQSA